MRACLEHALGYLAKAAALWPRFTEIVYTQAKCHALLGQIGDAALKLEVLSDRDRRYFSKASQDGDFESFRDAVEELFRRATISPGPLARGALVKLNEVADAVEWAKRSAPTSEGDKAAIESTRRAISDGRRSLPTLEVDIEGLCEDLDRMGQELKVISERSFQQNLKSSQEAIKSCEQRKTWCEDSIKQLERTMKSTSGAGAGWLFFIVSFVFAFFLKGSAFSPWLVITIVGTFVSNYISRDIKNRPHRLNVEENTRSIDESIRTLPLLKEKADSWTQEMRKYAAWQAEAHRPIPSNGEAAFKTAGDAV